MIGKSVIVVKKKTQESFHILKTAHLQQFKGDETTYVKAFQ